MGGQTPASPKLQPNWLGRETEILSAKHLEFVRFAYGLWGLTKIQIKIKMLKYALHGKSCVSRISRMPENLVTGTNSERVDICNQHQLMKMSMSALCINLWKGQCLQSVSTDERVNVCKSWTLYGLLQWCTRESRWCKRRPPNSAHHLKYENDRIVKFAITENNILHYLLESNLQEYWTRNWMNPWIQMSRLIFDCNGRCTFGSPSKRFHAHLVQHFGHEGFLNVFG